MGSIKETVRSRWDRGWIVEADYSQLEVVALAYLSQDSQLIDDIRGGVDLHLRALSAWKNLSYNDLVFKYNKGDQQTAAMRRAAKTLRFQLQYGAAANSMARKNNIPKEVAQRFIDAYYDTYPGIKKFNESVQYEVQNSAEFLGRRTAKGIPARTGTYRSCTGRKYIFTEYDAPDWMSVDTQFSRNELMNYPVQGLATGDIVPMMLPSVVSLNRPGVFFINTVHDSYLFDVHDAYIEEELHKLDTILSTTQEVFKHTFNIEFNVPLNYEITYGPSWGQQLERFE
jgi:DNA polymerase I-like protein with 3'-5' exonuclease and polymerase domains